MVKKCIKFDEAFYGSATVGERGQVVIPAEARQELGIEPGDKILFMHHPIHQGIMLFKIDAVKDFLDEFTASVQKIEARIAAEEE